MPRRDLSETGDLLRGELGVDVRRGEVAEQPDDVRARIDQVGDPPSAHAGVDLDMERNAFRPGRIDDDELQAAGAGRPVLAHVRRAEDDDARGRERVAQLEPLPHRRDAKRLRALVERSLGYRRGAVPIRIGLHHRPELGAAERCRQPAQVDAQGVAVDRDLGAHVLAGPRRSERG